MPHIILLLLPLALTACSASALPEPPQDLAENIRFVKDIIILYGPPGLIILLVSVLLVEALRQLLDDILRWFLGRLRIPVPAWLAERPYLRYLLKHHGQVDLRPLGGGERKQVQLTVEGVYVPLMTTPPARDAPPEKEVRAPERPAPVPIVGLLAEYDRLALIGAMGSGKTFFLRHVALLLARAYQKRGPFSGRRARRQLRVRLGWAPERRLLPVLISLADFTNRPAGCPLACWGEESGRVSA